MTLILPYIDVFCGISDITAINSRVMAVILPFGFILSGSSLFAVLAGSSLFAVDSEQ